MRTTHRAGFALAVAVFAAAGPAAAAEDKFKLKKAPGVDRVQNNCMTCHSLDYVQMNSPFLDRKGWEAEVTKMIKAYGAPVKADDVPVIVEYLTREYGVK
jgi:sulfite dehydrogenase (cytochrome) subunit B